MERGYAAVSHGQLHYRTAGEGKAVLLLHQVPLSGWVYEPLAERLAPHHRVIALDLPGFGLSDPLPGGFEVAGLVGVVIEFLDVLGIDDVRLFGHHTGSTVAGEIAVLYPDRVAALALSGYPLVREGEWRGSGPGRSEPSLQMDGRKIPVSDGPASDGGHLWRGWQRAVSLLYQGKGASGVVMLPPENLGVDDLAFIDGYVLNFLQSLGTARPTLEAVVRVRPDERLPLLQVPTLFLQALGPYEVPFCQRGDELRALVPGSRVASIENGDIHAHRFRADEVAQVLLDFFREHDGG